MLDGTMVRADVGPGTLCRWTADDMPQETRRVVSTVNGLVYAGRVDRIDRDGPILMCTVDDWPGLVERGEIEIVGAVK